MTSYKDIELEKRAIQAGMNFFLVKPIFKKEIQLIMLKARDAGPSPVMWEEDE